MTTTRKTTVTHTDGTVSTRSSKSRTYTHAIEIGPAPAAAYAADLNRQADAIAARIAAFRAAAADPKVQITSRGFRTQDDLHSYQATLVGTNREIYTWSSVDGRTNDILDKVNPIKGVVAYLTDYALRYAEDLTESVAKLRAEAAEILAKGQPVGGYSIQRWSSRPDLAAKALSEFDHMARRGHTVRVVKVDE